MLHQSQENPCRPVTRRVIRKGMGDTPKKTSESNSKCFICSSIPTSKNKVYLFEKTSTDLAGIIPSLVEFDVKKYYNDTNLLV